MNTALSNRAADLERRARSKTARRINRTKDSPRSYRHKHARTVRRAIRNSAK